MKLEQLSREHYWELYDFEIANKSWFESFVPPRPSAYETFDGFVLAMDALLQEQASGECGLYLGRYGKELALRANITISGTCTGDVGYRVGERYVGKGLATQALSSLLEIARANFAITQLTAMTTTNNRASMRVLEKQGFFQIKTEVDAIELNGERLSFVHYLK